MATATASKPAGPARSPYVAATLTRLARSRRFVNVRFDGDRRVHQSIILKVAPEAGSLAIDELFPHDDGSQGHAGQPCTVSASENGVEIVFATRVIDRVAAGSGLYYRLEMPLAIERRERRAAFRLDVGMRRDFSAELVLPDGRSLSTDVRNVSATGVGLIVEGDFSTVLERGMRFESCALHLGDELDLECGLEIRSVRADRHPRLHTAVGARLLDLAPDRVRALERLLMNEQRELRKRGM